MMEVVSEPRVEYEVQRWTARYDVSLADSHIASIENNTVKAYLSDNFIFAPLLGIPKSKLSALRAKIPKESSKDVDSQIAAIRSEWEKEYIFEINEETFRVPVILKHIADSIEEGKEILQYEDDWDDEGAVAIDAKIFQKAARFIIQYAVHVYYNSSVILTKPYIDILRDGSVSVHWEAGENRQLLIIFEKKENQQAVFYAEQGDRKIPLKGVIVPGDAVDESLAVWMKNYLH